MNSLKRLSGGFARRLTQTPYHIALCLLALTLTSVAGEVASGEAIEIAKRSLPFVREKGVDWIEGRNCASCHQVPAMLWSLGIAARVGLDADRKDLDERFAWSVDWRHWNQTGEKDGVDKVSAGNVDTMIRLLLARDAGAGKDGEWMREFREQLLKNQQKDGSWKAGGQLPSGKRPARETTEVTTMWTLLALNTYGNDGVPPEVKTRAEAFLATAQLGKSTEWFVAKLLLQPDNETLRGELLKQQRPDGGWGWLVDAPSDAFGTGLALYALARSGLPSTAEPVRFAVDFLKTTQQPNGSWAVPSTRANDKDKVIATSTYWGTCWAVIGLLESQKPAAKVTQLR